MKIKILAALLGMLVVAVGCISTVNDRSTAGVPFVKDKLENRYERPVSQVYSASVEVVGRLGTIARESVINPGTNEVKTIEGKVSERKVWVRVQAVDPNITAVTVQARTSGGGADILLTHDIATQIALALTK
ncbi:MAG: DUF3568 family protein [Verrucomicrobiota bacterium]|jgi:Protein of unknown function (DUF3568)